MGWIVWNGKEREKRTRKADQNVKRQIEQRIDQKRKSLKTKKGKKLITILTYHYDSFKIGTRKKVFQAGKKFTLVPPPTRACYLAYYGVMVYV